MERAEERTKPGQNDEKIRDDTLGSHSQIWPTYADVRILAPPCFAVGRSLTHVCPLCRWLAPARAGISQILKMYCLSLSPPLRFAFKMTLAAVHGGGPSAGDGEGRGYKYVFEFSAEIDGHASFRRGTLIIFSIHQPTTRSGIDRALCEKMGCALLGRRGETRPGEGWWRAAVACMCVYLLDLSPFLGSSFAASVSRLHLGRHLIQLLFLLLLFGRTVRDTQGHREWGQIAQDDRSWSGFDPVDFWS